MFLFVSLGNSLLPLSFCKSHRTSLIKHSAFEHQSCFPTCAMECSILTVCPWKVFTGLSWPSLHTWMHMSVLHEANVLLLCQSTSRAGAVER